nr:voltage-dependent anion-selective channel protein 2 [Aotus nancymaae]
MRGFVSGGDPHQHGERERDGGMHVTPRQPTCRTGALSVHVAAPEQVGVGSGRRYGDRRGGQPRGQRRGPGWERTGLRRAERCLLHFALQPLQLQLDRERAEWLQQLAERWRRPPSGDHQIPTSRGLAMATHGQTCARPMCIPPSYADLGKAARDIFNKGFGFGLVKLDVKTKSCSGVEFSTSGSSNTDTGKVTGTLETKYKWCEYGLTFTEKWNTDNTLGTEIAIEDQICQGLKLTFDTTFSPNTG